MSAKEAQTFMTAKKKIDWQSQSVETWLRRNFEEFKSEKIGKNRHMDHLKSANYCSEEDISKEENSPPAREKQLGNNSIRKQSFYIQIFQTQEIKNK